MPLTLTHGPQVAPAPSDATSPPARYWNPYLVGVLLGVVLLATYAIAGRGLGATAAFSAIVAGLVGGVSPEHVQSNIVHARFWNEGAPLLHWTLFLLGGALLGAFLSGWQGRRLSFTVERGPHISDSTRLALAFFGGFVAAVGARIAKGCTSGQALTGGALLNVGSWAFMIMVFVGGYAVAWFMRWQWR